METGSVKDKVVLVGVQLHGQPDAVVDEYLEELKFLAETAGAIMVNGLFSDWILPMQGRSLKTKVAEIKQFIDSNGITIVVLTMNSHRHSCEIWKGS